MAIIALFLAACRGGMSEADCFAAPLAGGVAQVTVSWGNVCLPAGQFILIRRGRSIAALRLAEIHSPDRERLIGCATYELFERSDGITQFRDGAFRRTTGRVSQFESRGVHPFVVQEGNHRLTAIGTTLQYEAPSCFSLPADAEVAVVPQKEIGEVDASDPSLKWFKQDPTMQPQ